MMVKKEEDKNNQMRVGEEEEIIKFEEDGVGEKRKEGA